MQTIARNGFTSTEIIAAVKSHFTTYDFRVGLLNTSNTWLRWLDTQNGGSYESNIEAEIKGICRVNLDEPTGYTINGYQHRVRPEVGIKMSRNGDDNTPWVWFVLGVFKPVSRQRKTDALGNVSIELTCYDRTHDLLPILLEPYTIPAGVRYTDEIQSILTGATITSQNVQFSSLTLPSPLEWQPDGRNRKIDVLIDLLQAKGLNYDWWMDENDRFNAVEWVDPALRAPVWTFDHVSEGQTASILYGDVTEEAEEFLPINTVMVRVTDPNRDVPIIRFARNTNPQSDTSINNIGQPWGEIMESDAPTEAIAQAQANRRLSKRMMRLERPIEIATGIMPWITHGNIGNTVYEPLDTDGKYQIVSHGFDFHFAARHKFRLRPVVSLD